MKKIMKVNLDNRGKVFLLVIWYNMTWSKWFLVESGF